MFLHVLKSGNVFVTFNQYFLDTLQKLQKNINLKTTFAN